MDLEQVLAAAAPEAFGRSCEHENARKPRRMRMRDFPVVFVHQIAEQPQSSVEKSDGVLELSRLPQLDQRIAGVIRSSR